MKVLPENAHMRLITLGFAGTEVALVALWLAAFWDALGRPHQRWYIEFR
jgi:hypothetical protein